MDSSECRQNIVRFQAAQTEKSAMALVNIMGIVAACGVPMLASHAIFTGLSVEGVLQTLPCLLIWVALFPG